MELLLKRLICFTVVLLEPGHLEEDSNHNDFWKEKILNFFCQRTNKIQDSTTPDATIENFHTVWTYWPLGKQPSNLSDWIIFFQVPRIAP